MYSKHLSNTLFGKTALITPAYGRDYRNRAEAERDLEFEKDFIYHNIESRWDGKPINLPQLKEAGYKAARVKFGKMRRVFIVQFSKLGS